MKVTMTEDEILARAKALVNIHKQDILEARADLVKDMLTAGYKPEEWGICDNLVDIQNGNTLEYKCWAAKANPTKL